MYLTLYPGTINILKGGTVMFIVYKTVNKIDGKFYIGVHKTLKEDFDGYLGSGKILKSAILKYGKDSFYRVTLFRYNDVEEAFKKEAELVTKILVDDPACYNCCVGGRGLRKALDNNFRTQEWKAKISAYWKGKRTGDNNPARKPGVGTKISIAKKGKPNLKIRGHVGANRKKVSTENGIFESATAAAKFYSVSITTIKDWCRSDSKPSFYYINDSVSPAR